VDNRNSGRLQLNTVHPDDDDDDDDDDEDEDDDFPVVFKRHTFYPPHRSGRVAKETKNTGLSL